MSRWLDDFRDAYARHPLSAVGMLAAIILAFTFASAAFAVHYSTGVRGNVPAPAEVVRPAQGRSPVSSSPARPGTVPPKSQLPAYAPESPTDAATTGPSPDPARPSPRLSRATPTAVQTTSASPTPSATTPSPDPTTTTPSTVPVTTTPANTSTDTSTPTIPTTEPS